MKYDYDVIVLGSGPAGFSCAMQTTKFGKTVLIVEADDSKIGGTWINKGTVPSKALRSAAKLLQSFHKQFGEQDGRKPYEIFRMEDIMDYKRPVLESKNRKVKEDIIKNEVATARGWGEVVDPHTVRVKDESGQEKEYTGKYILISTGSRPSPPEQINVEESNVLNYTSILDITHIPRKLAIIGSGIITLEYATIFSALGSRVTILSDLDEILPFLDDEIKQELFKSIKKRNIQIYNSTTIKGISRNNLRNSDEVRFTTAGDDRVKVVETEHVLYIGGRLPNTDRIGLDNISLKTRDGGFIVVDEDYRSNVPSIFAAGDVIGYPSLASASFLQGRLASVTMFGKRPDIDAAENSMPYGIYAIPEISGVGVTEKQAEELGIDVTVGRAYYRNLTKADINHETEGMLKLVFRTDNLKLLGVHIMGEQASDLIHIGQCVMANGGNIKYFIDRVLNYPTYSEAYKIAAFNGLNRVHKSGLKYQKILDKTNS
ncbi:MAG: Si-specific NAD(P)(+) transhydrogenase [Bacteroidetes bacterium]|jgi:NAD(P) transhydrogenase|nr:Si-specific NAD(P)(+) transhydrogenase [Bacteroidota bacterium]